MSRCVNRLFFFGSLSTTFFTAIAAPGQTVNPTAVGTVNLPPYSANSFGTSFRYNNSGQLYAFDGQNVYTVGGGTYTSIGAAPAGNSADAGPINFSQNGQQIVFSNGAGGYQGGSFNGEIFTIPLAGGAATAAVGSLPGNADLIPVPAVSTISGSASKVFVDSAPGSFGSSSMVSVFDTSTGTSSPVIANIAGASASLAFNPLTNVLYAENGYDYIGTNTGQIRSFSLASVDNAFATGTPLNFNSGTLVDPNTGGQSGGGLFVDKNGYLFAGGGDGSANDNGLVVFAPDGSIASTFDPGDYTSIAYDAQANEVLLDSYGSNVATLYNAADFEPAATPEPASIALFGTGTILLAMRRRRSACDSQHSSHS